MTEGKKGEILSIDSRKLRDVGNAIGFSVDINALRELGFVDDDGQLVENAYAKQVVRDDGLVEFELDVASDQDVGAGAD